MSKGKKTRSRNRNRSKMPRSWQNRPGEAWGGSPVSRTVRLARKTSDILVLFASPLLEHTATLDEAVNAIDIAVTAWNLSFLPEEERKKELEEELETLGGDAEETEEMRELLEYLIEGKRTYFGLVNRRILDVEVSETPDGRLSVHALAAMPPEEAKRRHRELPE